MKTIWNIEQLKFLKENYNEKGGNWCAQYLPHTAKQINAKAANVGIKVSRETRNKNRSIIASRPKPKLCGVSAEKFLQLNTKEIAYILGLLWADGSFVKSRKNQRIQIELIESDLITVKNAFLTLGKWNEIHRVRPNRRPQMSLMTTNMVLWQFLASHGYSSGRSMSPDSIIELLPNELKHYWFRGFFDGDGCIYIYPKESLYQVSFGGQYLQNWMFIQKILNELNIKHQIYRRQLKIGNKYSIIRFSGKNNCLKFAKYIYGEKWDELGFTRKFNKFQQISLARKKWTKKIIHDDQLV